MVYKLITAPTELAVTLADAKKQLNIDTAFTDDDTIITDCINAAALTVEKIIQGPVMLQTWEAQYTEFLAEFKLYKLHVAAISTLSYYDGANADAVVNSSNYQTDLASVPARLILNSGYATPTVYDRFDSVRIRFTAGYANAAAVPADLKQWIKVLITQFYEFRDYSVKPETEELIRKNLMSHAAWL